MEKKEIGVVYFCIQKRLFENSKGKLLTKKEAVYIIANLYHIPKKLRYAVLKEMENFGLVKSENRKLIAVEKPAIDLDNTSKVYRMCGLY